MADNEPKSRPPGHHMSLKGASNPDRPLARVFREYAESKTIADPFKGAYGTGQGSWQSLHEPPYSFYALMRMPLDNSTLNQCIDAMVTNIDGHGYRFEFIGEDKEAEKSEAAIAERKIFEDLLEYPNDDYTFQELRDRVRRDYETLGNAYIEVGRDAKDRIVMMSHVPAHTVRLTNRESTAVSVQVRLPREGGKETVRKINKNFRRYVQQVGNRRVFFKEYGDPRLIDPGNGEEMKAKGGKAALEASATELIHFCSYNPSSPYGLPRWFNQMRNILGTAQAEMVNLDFFKDNAIPAMMLLVAGGAVTQASIDDLTQHFNSVRGRGSMQRVMIVEATGDQAAADEEGRIPPPKVELKPLIHDRQTDATFLEYDKQGMDKIRSAFRLPPLYLGRSEDMTYATAKTSFEVAESQVFGPERQRFDTIINRKVLATYEPKYWAFRSNPPRLTDQDALIDAFNAFDAAGALTPNVAIGIANEMFDLEIAAVEEDWGDYPMAMVTQLLGAGKLKIELQNAAPVDPNAPTHFDELGNPIDPYELAKNKDKEGEDSDAIANDNDEDADKPPKKMTKAQRKKVMTDAVTTAMVKLHDQLRDLRDEE